MILLKLCELLPCNASKLFSRCHGSIVSIKDLIFRLFGQKYDFLHFWTDGCTLQRAKRRNSGSVRLRVRFSVLASKLHAYRHA